MSKIKIEFIDDSANEDGFKLSSNDISYNPNGFNIYSFKYKNETYTRTNTNTATAYGQKHGGLFWNGNYIQHDGSQIKQKEIYFATYVVVPDGNYTGTWTMDEFFVNASNNGQYRAEQIDLQNTFSNLWDGFTQSPITEIVLDSPTETEIGRITNSGAKWLETNTYLITNNSIQKNRTGETFQLISKVSRGNRFYNIRAFNDIGESDPAQYNKASVYDRHDVILYIGDENVIGSGTPTNLVNYDGKSVATLDEQIPKVLYRNFEDDGNGGFTSDGWQLTDFDNEANFGAEVSMLDYLQKRKIRGTSLWKMGISGSKLDDEFGANGRAINYISANIATQVDSLLNQYVQGRVAMAIINVGMDDSATDIVNVIKETLNQVRIATNHKELPILLTVTQGDQTDSSLVGAWLNEIANQDVFTHAIETSDLARETDSRTLTDDSLIALGERYATFAVPLLQGNLDVSAYEPIVWIDPSDLNFQQSGELSQITNKGSGVRFKASTEQLAVSGATINDLNAIDFDISDHYLYDEFHPWGVKDDIIEEAELFFVLKSQSQERSNLFLSGGSWDANERFLAHTPWDTGHIVFDCGIRDTRVTSQNEYVFEDGEIIILGLTTSKTENLIQMTINGKIVDSVFAYGGTCKIGSNFKLNSTNNTGQNVIMGEALMFSNNIGLDNRRKIEGYLSHKWNIPLHNSHPYADIAPTN